MKLCTVRFYMKSGNVIEADRVQKNFTIKSMSQKDANVIEITDFKQVDPKNRLMLTSLFLSQIEAIVTSNEIEIEV